MLRLATIIALLASASCGPQFANAHDDGHDAYYADSFKASKDGNYIAIITDTREDQQFGRPHVPPGTEVIVPNNKLKYDQGNPTGHGVIFMSRMPNDGDGQPSVYCYVVPGGV